MRLNVQLALSEWGYANILHISKCAISVELVKVCILAHSLTVNVQNYLRDCVSLSAYSMFSHSVVHVLCIIPYYTKTSL